MAERKWEKNIIYQTSQSKAHPVGSFPGVELFSIHEPDINGDINIGGSWHTGTVPEEDDYGPHYHDADEFLGLIGSNPKDYRDLGGEVEFWFEDEKYMITKTCVIFIPKMVKHAPIFFRRIDTPIFMFSTTPEKKRTSTYVDDPKWKHLKGPTGGFFR
jgi:hypothetical protein